MQQRIPFSPIREVMEQCPVKVEEEPRTQNLSPAIQVKYSNLLKKPFLIGLRYWEIGDRFEEVRLIGHGTHCNFTEKRADF